MSKGGPYLFKTAVSFSLGAHVASWKCGKLVKQTKAQSSGVTTEGGAKTANAQARVAVQKLTVERFCLLFDL